MLCAICHGTNRTTRLCKTCRADPANADWSETDEAVASDRTDAVIPVHRLADLQAGRGLQPLPAKQGAILRLIHSHTIRCAQDRRRPYAKQPRWVWRSEALTYDEVAHLVGCTESYVRKVVRKAIQS